MSGFVINGEWYFSQGEYEDAMQAELEHKNRQQEMEEAKADAEYEQRKLED